MQVAPIDASAASKVVFPDPGPPGRAVIRDQVARGGTALPWADRHAFAEAMLALDIESFRCAEANKGMVFFDRGIPDIIGYRRLVGLPVPDHLDLAARTLPYHHRVFIAPPWPEIFVQDAERKQSFVDARATCEAMREVYTDYGYELVALPLTPVEARVAFVMEEIARCI